MEDEKIMIPYIAFESVQARNERHFKRLWITIIILAIMLFASNALWIWFIYGTDYETYEITADDNSNANYIGGDMDGDINNGGENKSEEDNTR